MAMPLTGQPMAGRKVDNAAYPRDGYLRNISAANGACDELLHTVHWDGKAKPLAECEYPGVYADDLALQVDQRPAAVAVVDSSIGLDIFITF